MLGHHGHKVEWSVLLVHLLHHTLSTLVLCAVWGEGGGRGEEGGGGREEGGGGRRKGGGRREGAGEKIRDALTYAHIHTQIQTLAHICSKTDLLRRVGGTCSGKELPVGDPSPLLDPWKRERERERVRENNYSDIDNTRAHKTIRVRACN